MKSIDQVVDFSFSFRFLPFVSKLEAGFVRYSEVSKYIHFVITSFLSIEPGQVRPEILQLMSLVAKAHPRSVLEIGTASGGTLFLLAQCAGVDARIISIDLPGGLFGSGYPTWKIPIFKSFCRETQSMLLIRGDSHDKEVVKAVKSHLDIGLDFLLIDGDHRYSKVKQDFELYSPLVEHGMIAFHDVAALSPDSGCEGHKFWDEIKNSYKHVEIVENWNQGWGGFGIIVL